MPELPVSWIGLAGLAVIIAGQCWQAWTTYRQHRDVNEQLTNSHGTNLRDDIDRIAASQERMQADIAERIAPAITDIRGDIARLSEADRIERAERIADADRIAAQLRDRLHGL